MNLEDDQCGACGCYCVSHPPKEWAICQTDKGPIQLCYGCFQKYGESHPNPGKDYDLRRVRSALSRAESEVEELEEELRLLEESP